MRQQFLALLFGSTPFALAAASVLSRRRWSFVAGACLVAAIVLLFARGADAAFVVATLGLVAWFWDQRNRLRPLVIEAERERLARSNENFDDDVDESDEDGEDRLEATGDKAQSGDGKEAEIDRDITREVDRETNERDAAQTRRDSERRAGSGRQRRADS